MSEGNPSAISHVIVTLNTAIEQASQAEGVTPLDIWLGIIQFAALSGLNNGLSVDEITENARAFATASEESSTRGLN